MKTSEMKTDYEAAADWIKSIDPFGLAEEFRDHREAAYLEERAKIVAWLKGFRWFSTAAAIEAGEHLK